MVNAFTQKGTSLEKAADILRQGGLVAIPTETVYGLAGNAFNASAVTDIFKVKNRPHFNPLIVHTHSLEAAAEFCTDIPDALRELAEHFWPGPLTLLLPRNEKRIHDLITASLPRVAVRVPSHSICLNLLRSLEFPLAAPSANPFGYVSPTTAEHVLHQLEGKIPYILDGGPCEVGLESTIAGIGESGKVVLYRQGGLSAERMKSILGYLPETEQSSTLHAPGMMKSHYATHTKILFAEGDLPVQITQGRKIGALRFRTLREDVPASAQKILSVSGSLDEAARNLFSAMREMDKEGYDLILAEPFPEQGLGRAINDRLKRAAAERF